MQQACAVHLYSGASIDGQVVDAETKKPLAGAVVASYWPVYGGVFHYDQVDELLLMEAVTDSGGHYHLASWGPIFTWKGELWDSAPVLIFIKRGYAPVPKISNSPGPFELGPKVSNWNGKTVELKRIADPSIEDLENWASTADNFSPNGLHDPCKWMATPRIAAEFIKLGEFIKQGNFIKVGENASREDRIAAAAASSLPTLETFEYKKCVDDPQALIRRYLGNE